ncbi:hypothetical protein MNBD_GAMMA22-932 [hydrothermal vent metagenome]|uniref:Rhodanese domain-containing protein n=1 Tax=hydrothermal vent metagenome TaxID=652676 RepID=A0A3B1ALW6_9ZZZZ
MNKCHSFRILIIIAFLLLVTNASALNVKISQNLTSFNFDYNGQIIKIGRIQDQSNHLTGGFAKTSRKCPPFCIQPFIVAQGVNTVGELELIDFLKSKVTRKKGVLIDARTASWHAKGTIPGSINIPFTVFSKKTSSRKMLNAMKQIGVKRRDDSAEGSSTWTEFKIMLGLEQENNSYWDFKNAKEIMLWCNGMWCGQSPRAIKGLLKQGYPPEKIHYYRGGMQAWKILGLTVVIP